MITFILIIIEIINSLIITLLLIMMIMMIMIIMVIVTMWMLMLINWVTGRNTEQAKRGDKNHFSGRWVEKALEEEGDKLVGPGH